MFDETVTTKGGQTKRVVGDNEKVFKEAVKTAKAEEAPVYPNINHPVAKGHDLVAVDGDVNRVLVDGTGAHNSPNNAVEPFNGETNSEEKVVGLDEPAYKTVAANPGVEDNLVEATDAEVAAAREDSKPADEVQ